MKKLLYCAAALATMFFTACQQENLEPAEQGTTVNFSVAVPGEISTKAVADGNNVDELYYAIYKYDETSKDHENGVDNAASIPLASGRVDRTTERPFNVTFDLLADQNYVAIFWAQKKVAEPFYVWPSNGDLRTITFADKKDAEGNWAATANLEDRAAFFRTYEFNTITPQDHVVDLYRPFAQLNLGTTLASLEPKQDGANLDYVIDVEKSQVKVTGLATEFNTISQLGIEDICGKADKVYGETFVFTLNDVITASTITDDTAEREYLTVKDKEGKDVPYEWIAMNYFFATDNCNVKVDYEIVTDKGVVTNTVDNVPVKENFRTNIIGNLLTSKTDFEIVVDPDFEQPDYVWGDEWSHLGNYTYTINEGATAGALMAVLGHADAAAKAAATKAAGPVVTINLSANVEWQTGAGIGSTPLLPEDSPISAVTINGNGKTFTATGKGVGQVRLANGALLTFKNVKVVDLSVSYAETAWEYGYLEFGGNLAFNECEFVNAIMMESENAAFTNCSFNSNHDNEYAVWVNEGNTTFNGCTFAGARGLKVHEAYGSEVASVTVDGCTFSQLTKKPGIALGDLNADTSVTIQNSTFDRCQAGDQGLFIYETDTDVNTFTLFVCKNNVVIPSGDAAVEQEDGTVIVSTAAGLKAAIAAANNDKFTEIKLADGTYTGAFDIDAKSVKIVAINKHQATIDGLVHGLNFAHVTLEGVVLTNATPAASASARHNADYYCLGSYVTDWVIEDCIFNVNNQGKAAGKGAINIYAGRDDYELYDGFEFTVKKTTFNCNGERPIRGKTNSWIEGCTFVDQHRYAIQVQGNSGLVSETVKFVNNTIVDPCKTSEEAYVASVSISKSLLLENAAFIIEGNTDAKFVYDNNDNVKITTCTLNGAPIVAGQCVSIPNVSDAREVKFNAIDGATLVATSGDLTAAINASAAHIVLLPGVYDGTFYMNSNIKVEGQEGAIVHCISLNGAANVTLKNIQFDAAGAKMGCDGNGKAKQYANIITGDSTKKPLLGAHNLVIDGCKFTGTFANGGASIAFTDQNRKSGASGNVTIKNCTFNTVGNYYDIYGHYTGDGSNGYGAFAIEANTFKTVFSQGMPVYLGRYASKTPVVVKGNTFETVASLEDAVYVQDHSTYGVSIDASNNTFAN